MATTPVDVFADAYQSTLSAGISAGATSFIPTSVTGAPSVDPTLTQPTQFRAVLQSASYPASGTREIVAVTDSRTGTWTCSATANAYVTGDIIAQVVTAGSLGSFGRNNLFSGVTGRGALNPLTGFYSPPGAKLAFWRSQLGKALQGTGVAELLFIGPSTTMGAPTGVKVSAAKQLVAILAARGVPVNDGYAMALYSNLAATDASQDPRWSWPDGAWTNFASTNPYVPGVYTGTNGKRAIFTSTDKGTVLEFEVVGASGPFTYSIDGGTAVAVGAQAVNTYSTPVTVTGLPYGTHSVVIQTTSTSLVYLLKARVRNPSGVVINNAGFSGVAMEDWDKTDATLSGYPSNAFGLPYAAAQAFANPPTYIVDCAAWYNSLNNSTGHTSGYSPATFKATLDRIIGQCKANGGDVILLNPAAPSETVQFGSNATISNATYNTYRQVIYDLADKYALFLLDEPERVGLWVTANANGLKADAVHNNGQGYGELAASLADFLYTPSFSPPVSAVPSSRPPGARRQIACRATVYGSGLSDGTLQGTTFMTKHLITEDAEQVVLGFGNFYGGGAVNLTTPGPNSITVKASIEVNGFYFPAYTPAGYSRTLTLAAGAYDEMVTRVRVRKGDYVKIHTYVSVTTLGQKWPLGLTTYIADGEGNNGANTDATLTTVATAFAFSYHPCSITGSPAQAYVGERKGSVAIVGDSIANGQGEVPNDHGFVSDALGMTYGWIKLSQPGEKTTDFTMASVAQYKAFLADFCDTAICNYGRNDLTAGSTTATIQAALIAVWQLLNAMGVRRVFQCTIAPASSSTDSWATTTNQTTLANNTTRVALNQWIRAGAPMSAGAAAAVGAVGALLAGQTGHPLVGMFDTATPAETAIDSGIWNTAIASPASTDGIHPKGPLHQAMGTAIDLSKLVQVAV